MSEAHKVSVVIPTYQRCASVERALRALARQTLPASEYEVIVSIDGSDDGTKEMVAQFSAPYHLRSTWQQKSGRAAACNAGIRVATGELVVLLDDDMEPTPGFLAVHAQAHADRSRLGVLGAVPVVVDRSSPPVVEYIASRFNSHLTKLSRSGYQIGIRDFYSGNFSIPSRVLLEVGLFDEGFKNYGNEDGELAIRLRQAGVRLAYCAEAVARQHYEKDFPALARDKIAQGRTSVECALRHPETVPELRIGTYRRGSRKWRLLRSVLIAATGALHSLPDWITCYVGWLEQKHSMTLQARYQLALDYFYWLGVRSALRENPESSRRLAL